MFLKPKVNSGLVAAASISSITILRELIGDDDGRVGVLTEAYTNTLQTLLSNTVLSTLLCTVNN